MLYRIYTRGSFFFVCPQIVNNLLIAFYFFSMVVLQLLVKFEY